MTSRTVPLAPARQPLLLPGAPGPATLVEHVYVPRMENVIELRELTKTYGTRRGSGFGAPPGGRAEAWAGAVVPPGRWARHRRQNSDSDARAPWHVPWAPDKLVT